MKPIPLPVRRLIKKRQFIFLILPFFLVILAYWLYRSNLIFSPVDYNENSTSHGTLVINTDKNIYAPMEPVRIQISYLNPDGKTDCEADFTLTVSGPLGQNTVLTSAKKEIVKTLTCRPENSSTNNPDYTALFIPEKEGTYQLNLVNNAAQKGVKSKFTVRERKNGQFTLLRTGAVKVNPLTKNRFPMTITVSAGEDFRGTVTETLPSSFNIVWYGPAKVEKTTSEITLTWQLDLKKGEVKELVYSYGVPKETGKIYKLGKIVLRNYDGRPLFEELNYWKLAVADDNQE